MLVSIWKYSADLEDKIKNQNMDIEHIVPKARFKHRNDNSDSPIGSLLNLTFMTVFENRSKGKETIYTDPSINKAVLTTYSDEMIKKFNYPTKDEISFVGTSEFVSRDLYIKFITNRKERVKNLIFNTIKKL